MSLINDALKKVSEAERGKPSAPQPDFETRAMQPVSYQERPAYLFWISLALFVAAIGVAGFVYAKSRTAAAQAQPIVAQTAAEIPAVATAVKEPPKVVAAQASVPAPAVVTTSNTTSTVTLAPTAQVAPAPAQPAPVIAPASPTFRLKGILYTKSPTALINEASVQVGGEVDGATVTKIESTSVTLDYQGKTTILKLGAH